MKELNALEESARYFIDRIGTSSRKGKRVDLFHGGWDGSLIDPAWINGALSTTALRKRPHSILKPNKPLGYAAAKSQVEKAARKFYDKLCASDFSDYDVVFLSSCGDLKSEVEKNSNLYWTFGRSQKFFNILTKYWFCVALAYSGKLSQSDRDLVEHYSGRFHAPVDSITLRHLRKIEGSPQLEGIYWGWNMSEQKYSEIQDWFRSAESNKLGSAVAYELREIW